ncbi:cytochrome P450 4C1-like [Diachasmimorpha longicaudata]|uniref:cytochrome P450 4C1-like n=1 Tax=Diachasmimorpha longicaudata TaxID=58733 RepID=UPI0030B8D21B
MTFIKGPFEFLPPVSMVFEILLPTLVFLSGLKLWRNIRDYFHRRSKFIEFAKTLPGPPTLPVLGNALELWESDRASLVFAKISRDLDAPLFRFWLGPVLKVIVTDPRDFEIILSSGKSTQKDQVYQLLKPIVQYGLINIEGVVYRHHKKLLLSILNHSSVMDKYVELFNRYSKMYIASLEKRVDTGEFDVEEDVKHCVGHLAFETILGMAETIAPEDQKPFVERGDKALNIFTHRMARPWLYPNLIFRLTKRGRDFYWITDKTHEFINSVIVQKTREYTTSHEKVMSPLVDSVIDHVMKSGGWSQPEIRDELTTTFVGLNDTIGGLLCFVTLMLAIHPDVQEKARAEVKEIVGEEEVTTEAISRLDYIDMIVRETIRLFPVGPLLPRISTEPIELTTCTVPEGCSLYMVPFATHRDPRYWENPEEFIPERFTPENSRNRHPFAFLPFSSGFRSCPGSKYGMMSLKVLVAYIVRSFHLESTMKLNKIQLHTHISTRSTDGYKLSLRKI